MDMNIGIDSKPRTRRGRRRFTDRLVTLAGDRNDDINDPTGLFRRPNSRANSKLGSKGENRTGTDIFVPETSSYGNDHIVSQKSETPRLEGVLHDVANAPNINVNQISTMYQLGFMNAKNTSLAKLDDIDLSLLLRFLCLEEEVNDEKVPWTWDYLFASVSTEMRDEWAQDEERDGGDYEDENLIK
uniref:Intraflagellar transport protein 43 homolog n=1 Tax=Elaeophora elaphi TaxID=1147741 RepID=A0A158Q914_9BILA